MARGRMITNNITRDKRVDNLSDDTCRLLFTWLITFADREGRTYGDASIVHAMVFPRRRDISIDQVEIYLNELHECGLIVRYDAEDDTFIFFPGFDKNQPGMRKDREPDSELPAPSKDNIRQIAGRLPEDCRKIAGLREWNGMEENGMETRGGKTPDYYSDDAEILNILTDVTGFTAFPVKEREERIAQIRSVCGRDSPPADYLRPYYSEWIKRGYSKSNLAWLDWAVVGEIPPVRKKDSLPNHKPTKAEELAAAAAELYGTG